MSARNIKKARSQIAPGFFVSGVIRAETLSNGESYRVTGDVTALQKRAPSASPHRH